MALTSAKDNLDTQDCKKIPRIDSSNLFEQNKIIEILHNNEIYRLQITRQNKLILTK